MLFKSAQFKMASVEDVNSNDGQNTQVEVEDSNKTSDNDNDSSSTTSSNTDDEAENNISNLETKVSHNPYEYSVHVDLINALRKLGELERLRNARERMAKHFPLSSELWLSWVEDEIKLAESDEEKAVIKDLFERAIKDYLSVELWLEYAQFSIGCMGQEEGVEAVRSVFERSLTAAGLHVAKGVVLWEAYREFEDVMTAMLEQKASSSAEDKEKYINQKKRTSNIFRRQLAVPLLDMQRSFAEYGEWVASGKEGVQEVDKNVELNYKKALTKLNKILPFEMELVSYISTPDRKMEVFQKYVTHEKADGDPARVQCIFERAVAELCLDPELWLEYIQYLDSQLKIDSVVIPICERAVRNCPWNSQLWQYYLRVMERYGSPHTKVQEVVEQALAVGFSTAEDYRNLWLSYMDYLRRRVKWEDKDVNDSETAKELRATYNRACEHLAQYFGLNGDPTCAVLQSWARMEAIHGRDMETTRRLWNDIMSQGHDRLASMWLEYISLEKCYGDTKHLRRLYQRALNSVQDWPESVGDAWLNFEKDEGTLESLEICEVKYKARMNYIKEQRDKQAVKEAEAVEREERRRHVDPRGQGKRREKDSGKRKLDDAGKWAAAAAESVLVKKESPVKDPTPQQKVEPPPGFKEQQGSSKEEQEPPMKKIKKEETTSEHGVTVTHDSSKDNRTVFISNLEYTVEEAAVRERFSAVGTITDLRLVKDFKGRFKGYGYVEFSSSSEAAEALKKDREPVGDRPMYVSKCDPDRQTRQPGFKYSTELEKSKLFVRGLPLSTTKEELSDLFKKFGKLKDVRIVTYRNGHSKGLAYVEFVDQAAAAHALIKTDGMTLSDRTISVAISKPPERKGGGSGDATSVPVLSLGGGPKEIGARGRGRTQMFVPSSIQRSKPTAAPATTTTENTVNKESSSISTTNGDSKTDSIKSKVMSNNDFRQMLLGKKK